MATVDNGGEPWPDSSSLVTESVDSNAKLVTLAPPTRFAHVSPGVTRGAYPTLRNFRFLSRLQLKTIISLTPEPPTADLILFGEMAGLKIVHFPVSRLATLSDALQSNIISAVNICIEAQNHPVYLHCLDGRRISSLVVLMLRRVQGWTPLAALSEYWRFQASFRSAIPTAEVEKTTKELEMFAAQCNDIVMPESMPKWLWGGDRSATVPGVLIKAPAVSKDLSPASSSTALGALTPSGVPVGPGVPAAGGAGGGGATPALDGAALTSGSPLTLSLSPNSALCEG